MKNSIKSKKCLCNVIYGITFIVTNIVVKLLVFRNEEIWFNNMPAVGRNNYYGFNDFMQLTIQKMIPFIIIGFIVTLVYTFILYRKHIFNKKRDVIIPILLFIITEIILFVLFNGQYKIAV